MIVFHAESAVLPILVILSLLRVTAPAQGPPHPTPPRLLVTEGEQVVVSVLGADGEIEVARLAPQQLVLPLFAPFISVSPDGKWGTYITARGATPDGVSLDGAVLWLVDMDSGHAQDLWHFADQLWPSPLLWSPDSKWLAFVQIPANPVAAGAGMLELWVLDTGNGRAMVLVRDPSFTADLFYQGASPQVRWSAGGEAISYAAQDPSSGQMVVHTFDLDGSRHSPHLQPPVAADKPARSPAVLPCEVTRFSQRDPRWAAQTMQTCGLTIAQAGCALTSTAMTFRYYGDNTDPGLLNGCLGAYACPIYWGVAAPRCGAGRVSFAGTAAFGWSKLEQELQAGHPAIVYVCKYDDCNHYTHWVVAVDGSGSSATGYRINDPSDGQEKSLAAYTDAGWVLQSLRLYHGTPACDPIEPAATIYLPLIMGGSGTLEGGGAPTPRADAVSSTRRINAPHQTRIHGQS